MSLKLKFYVREETSTENASTPAAYGLPYQISTSYSGQIKVRIKIMTWLIYLCKKTNKSGETLLKLWRKKVIVPISRRKFVNGRFAIKLKYYKLLYASYANAPYLN